MLLVQNTFSVNLMVEGPTRRASVLINLVILLTYPTNFFIYCAMSTQFRNTFRSMFAACRPSAYAAVVANPRNGDGEAMLMIRMNTVTASQL